MTRNTIFPFPPLSFSFFFFLLFYFCQTSHISRDTTRVLSELVAIEICLFTLADRISKIRPNWKIGKKSRIDSTEFYFIHFSRITILKKEMISFSLFADFTCFVIHNISSQLEKVNFDQISKRWKYEGAVPFFFSFFSLSGAWNC